MKLLALLCVAVPYAVGVWLMLWWTYHDIRVCVVFAPLMTLLTFHWLTRQP